MKRCFSFGLLFAGLFGVIPFCFSAAPAEDPDGFECEYHSGNMEYHWTNDCSPIYISETVSVPSAEILTIDPGVEVYFAEGAALIVRGAMQVDASGGMVALRSATAEKWAGVSVNKTEHQFTISNLNISGAETAISLISSRDVGVIDNILDGNNTAIYLYSDDGVRSRINVIKGNQIKNNLTGVVAVSTGAEVRDNLLANNDKAIRLDGSGPCGAGSVCGWRSNVVSNLIDGGLVGISSRGHVLEITDNDIFNTGEALIVDNFSNTNYIINRNNIAGWRSVGIKNDGVNVLDVGDLWISGEDSDQAFCDIRDNLARGEIIFQLSENAFPKSHPYERPNIEPSGTGGASCDPDGYNYVDTDQNWSGEKTVTESIHIASGTTVSISEGSVISVDPGVQLSFAGSLSTPGGTVVHFQPSVPEQPWAGIRFIRADAQNVSNLMVSGATTAISLISSSDVSVADNIISDNETGIYAYSDDGVRSRVNPIANNQIENNTTGILAFRTGVDVRENFFDGNDKAIRLDGIGPCGAGSVCGWRSNVVSNLIDGGLVGISSRGHVLEITDNDIFNAGEALIVDNFSNTNYTIDRNNVAGWRSVGIKNEGVNVLDVGNLWISAEDSDQAFCDIRDNLARGEIVFQLSENAFPQSHPYERPNIEPSGTAGASCDPDGFNYVDTDQDWSGEKVVTESIHIASGTTVSISEGSVISVDPGVQLSFGGALNTPGDTAVQFQSSDPDQPWVGIRFIRADAQTVSNLYVTGAVRGVSLVSSQGVSVYRNVFEGNETAVHLYSDDGIRSRVNSVKSNWIKNNSTGVNASRTGADINKNIFHSNDVAIELSGQSCGGGGACGYFSSITTNLLSGNVTAMDLAAHTVEVYDNDITCNVNGIFLNEYGGSDSYFDGNNFGLVDSLHFSLASPGDIDLGSSWFHHPECADEHIFDFHNNPSLGEVAYQFMEAPNSTTLNSLDIFGFGLTVYEEITQGSCPHLMDTDGDGYTDKEEYEYGSDPNDPWSNPEIVFRDIFKEKPEC